MAKIHRSGSVSLSVGVELWVPGHWIGCTTLYQKKMARVTFFKENKNTWQALQLILLRSKRAYVWIQRQIVFVR